MLGCQSRSRWLKSPPQQKDASRFLHHLHSQWSAAVNWAHIGPTLALHAVGWEIRQLGRGLIASLYTLRLRKWSRILYHWLPLRVFSRDCSASNIQVGLLLPLPIIWEPSSHFEIRFANHVNKFSSVKFARFFIWLPTKCRATLEERYENFLLQLIFRKSRADRSQIEGFLITQRFRLLCISMLLLNLKYNLILSDLPKILNFYGCHNNKNMLAGV